MKRILASILIVCVSIGLAGCSDKTKTEKKSTTSTPGGTTEKTTTTETSKSGENPPKTP